LSGLPKTRSGKIMRRILRKIAEGDFSNFGDTSTLLNPEIVDEIKDNKYKKAKVENLSKDFQPFFYQL
jgi:acetyl-CoA synthetase